MGPKGRAAASWEAWAGQWEAMQALGRESGFSVDPERQMQAKRWLAGGGEARQEGKRVWIEMTEQKGQF